MKTKDTDTVSEEDRVFIKEALNRMGGNLRDIKMSEDKRGMELK